MLKISNSKQFLVVLWAGLMVTAGVAQGADEAGPALVWAAGKGDNNQVAQLLATGANPNVQDRYGNTALFFAAQKGYASIVTQLLAAGADLNLANMFGSTPFIEACYKGHAAVVQKLLDAGAEATGKALSGAVLYGHGPVVQKLLAAGANPNYSSNGQSMLQLATANGDMNIVDMLVAAGAV